MSVLRYAWRELAFRRSRSLIAVLSFAIAVLAAVLLTALAASYARAVRAPIETVGADVIVQITGDIPPKLEGLVFPHPNALVPAAAVAAIRGMEGVISVTRGVYMWELAPDHYQSILGIDDSEAGLGSLSSRLIDGKTLGAGDRAVLLDSDFAAKQGAQGRRRLSTSAARNFPCSGSWTPRAAARWCAPMSICRSRRRRPWRQRRRKVQALYPFGRDDANLLLVKVDRQHLEGVVDKIVTLLGKKGIVSSELSFREALSGVLFLSQRMGLIVAAVIGAFAAAFVLRATASAIQERRRELAVLQAIGWPWRHIRQQVLHRECHAGDRGRRARHPAGDVDRGPARPHLGDARSAVGFELDAAFHSGSDARSHADHHRADRHTVAGGGDRRRRQPFRRAGRGRSAADLAAATLVAAAQRVREPP